MIRISRASSTDRPDLQHSSVLLLLSTYSYRYYSSFPSSLNTNTRERTRVARAMLDNTMNFKKFQLSLRAQHNTQHLIIGRLLRVRGKNPERPTEDFSSTQLFFFLPPLIHFFSLFFTLFFPSSSSTSSRSSSSVVFFGSTYLSHSHTIFFSRFFFIIYIYFLSLFSTGLTGAGRIESKDINFNPPQSLSL